MKRFVIAMCLILIALGGCKRHTTTDHPQPQSCISKAPDSTPTPYPHAWEVCQNK